MTAPAAAMRAPLGAAIALHVALLVAVIAARPGAPPAMPPMYRVDLVAAPPGPRAAGVVKPAAAATPPPPTRTPPPPARENVAPKAMPLPAKPLPPRPTPPAATPSPTPAVPKPATPAPVAAGGATGGRGADVATVRTEGIDFQYPGYLSNIVRQIALNFHPKPGTVARAEVMFLIKRDGTVSNFRFVTRSGDFAFDLEAQGAVEAAANARSFGKLPEGFADDVLPVIFTFDPRVLR